MKYDEIIKKYKSPFFIYNISELHRRIQFIRSKLDSTYKLIYAVKANPFIIKELDSLVDGYEICSFGEYEICKGYRLSNEKFVISGVNKDKDSIWTMFQDGVRKYTVESIQQYLLLRELVDTYQEKIQVLIRLTSGNQFGVSEEDFLEIIEKNLDCCMIEIVGIEYFSGTQKSSIKKVNREIDKILSFILEVEEKYSISLKEVEYGTGSFVSYFQGEEYNEEEYFQELNLALHKLTNRIVSLEMGRSIAASCGEYVTRIVDMKSNSFGNSIILDGGMNHLVYYGQTMAMRVPYFRLYPKRDSMIQNFNLYGSLCTINDIIIKNIDLNCPMIGDYFVFSNVGAYSITEGIALFLSREMPLVFLYDEEKGFRLVRNTIKTSTINCSNYEVKE